MKLILIFFLCFLIKVYTNVINKNKDNFLRRQKSTAIKKNCERCIDINGCTYMCAQLQMESNAYRLIDLLHEGKNIVVKCIFPGQISWHDGNACHAVITALRNNDTPLEDVRTK